MGARSTERQPPSVHLESFVSTQLESCHFFKTGDVVQHLMGELGSIREGMALYAFVRWDDGREEEIDQLDPMITVVERGARE